MIINNHSFLKERFRGYLPVVVDVETGGFDAKNDALLEICAITLKMDNNGLLQLNNQIHFQVQPFDGAHISADALTVNGIKDPFSPLRNAVSEGTALREVFKLIRKDQQDAGCTRAIMVAHNASFDHRFMMQATQREKLKRNPFHPFSTFDTVTLAGLALGQTVLIKACQQAGIEFDQKQAHGALYDTQRTAELFCFIVNRWQALGGWPLGNALI